MGRPSTRVVGSQQCKAVQWPAAWGDNAISAQCVELLVHEISRGRCWGVRDLQCSLAHPLQTAGARRDKAHSFSQEQSLKLTGECSRPRCGGPWAWVFIATANSSRERSHNSFYSRKKITFRLSSHRKDARVIATSMRQQKEPQPSFTPPLPSLTSSASSCLSCRPSRGRSPASLLACPPE